MIHNQLPLQRKPWFRIYPPVDGLSEPPAGLSNKELREGKKKEKAAKRLAKKAEQSGQTVEEKEEEAKLLKERNNSKTTTNAARKRLQICVKQKIKQENKKPSLKRRN